MKLRNLLAAATLLLVAAGPALAIHPSRRLVLNGSARATAQSTPWHGGYADPAWGMPVAVVVPPTADYEFVYGARVGMTRLRVNSHQWGVGYPGGVEQGFAPARYWPMHTRQLGAYYIRGPW